MGRNERMSFLGTLVMGLLLFTAAPSLSFAQNPPATWPKAVSIASVTTQSALYTVATGMADLLKKRLNVQAHAESSNLGKNLVLLNEGSVEFAVTQSDLNHDAARGIGDYKKYGNMKLRLLFSGSKPLAAFVVRADSGIKHVRDLKGKPVMNTFPANMTFTKCGIMILKTAGMTLDDIKDMKFAGPPMANEALREKRISAWLALFPEVGTPAWAEEMNSTVGIRLITGEADKLDQVIKEQPYATKGVFLAKYYGEMINNKDMPSITIPTNFLCRPDLPEDFVYEAMKVWFENKKELISYHIQSETWLANPLAMAVLPYHPGAIRFYKEKGLWTDKLQETQEKLLKEVGASGN